MIFLTPGLTLDPGPGLELNYWCWWCPESGVRSGTRFQSLLGPCLVSTGRNIFWTSHHSELISCRNSESIITASMEHKESRGMALILINSWINLMDSVSVSNIRPQSTHCIAIVRLFEEGRWKEETVCGLFHFNVLADYNGLLAAPQS